MYIALPLKEVDASVRKWSMTPWNCPLNKHNRHCRKLSIILTWYSSTGSCALRDHGAVLPLFLFVCLFCFVLFVCLFVCFFCLFVCLSLGILVDVFVRLSRVLSIQCGLYVIFQFDIEFDLIFSRFLILCSICCVKVPLELQQNPRRSILFLNRQYVRSCLKEGSIKTWSTSW